MIEIESYFFQVSISIIHYKCINIASDLNPIPLFSHALNIIDSASFIFECHHISPRVTKVATSTHVSWILATSAIQHNIKSLGDINVRT